jgi:hypothetical protein
MRPFLIFLIVFISITLSGQEWAPVGAEWYYDKTEAFSGDITFQRIYCDSIVNFNGIDCKKINLDYCACNNYFCDKLYTYELNDTIFFYNQDLDTFEILYDFNALQGYSWEIHTKFYESEIDTITVHVDSLDLVEINSVLLKRFYVTYSYGDNKMLNSDSHKENSIIIECLGDLNYIINITNPLIVACDINFIHSLRCYEDPQLGLYSTGLRDSCNYVYYDSSIDLKQDFDDIKIYPNPVIDHLKLDNTNGIKLSYEIINTTGITLLTGSGTDINLSAIQDGIYYLRLFTTQNNFKTILIIKHLP